MKHGITKDQIIGILAAGFLYFLATFIAEVRASIAKTQENSEVLSEHTLKIGDIEKIREALSVISIDIGTVKNSVNELKSQKCFFKKPHY